MTDRPEDRDEQDTAEASPKDDAPAEAKAAEEKEPEKAATAEKAAKKEKAKAKEKSEAAPPAAPAPEPPKPSRPVHVVRGSVIAVLAGLGLFAIMALEHQIDRGPLWGILLTFALGLGTLDALGLLTGRPGETATPIDWKKTWLAPEEGEPLVVAPIVALPVAILVAVVGAFVVSWEQLPWLLVGALVILAPAALRRPALLVFVIASGVMLPMLGAYGLYDPWETHYGEVAREILSRDDWISLWWAHEEWFFSKPIFIFWIEALSMGAFGIDPHPHMHPLHPEWAVRFPIYLLSVTALLCVYHLVKHSHGKKTAAITALVVGTLPHFFMLSHQSITDMPFVSTMTMAMCMLGIAIAHRPDYQVRQFRMGPLVVSVQSLLVFVILAVALPQILYLFTRNVTLVEEGFAWHGDRFMFGSAGNAGNPGHPAAREMVPVFDGLFAQPGMQALYYTIGLGLILSWLKNERRARTLAMFGFYFFCALSFMAKGIPGFALPGMAALFYLVGSRRWSLLTDGHLRVGAGILTILICGAPWYVAMYIRHGTAFTDRLLVHDHLNRLAAGVHGDNSSVEYFLEQLGYGMFPWIALAPLAVGAWIAMATKKPEPEKPKEDPLVAGLVASVLGGINEKLAAAGSDARVVASAPATSTSPLEPTAVRDVLMIVGLWGTSAFVLFSAMQTKFHHYIFPAVPAAGILMGIAFAPLFGELASSRVRQVAGTILAALAPAALVVGIGSMEGDLRGISPEGGPPAIDWVPLHPWNTQDSIAWILLGSVLLVGAFFLLGRDQNASAPPRPATALGLFAAPAVVGLVGRDLAWATNAHPWGYERLLHLFCYNYQRSWPEQFDYRPVLTGFAVVATLAIGLAAIPQVRALAARVFLGTALAFSVWCLDVYLIDLAPHWSQREILFAVYDVRENDEPIIGWQLNWKGENFYTNGAVYIFEDLDTRELERWAAQHPGERVYFVMEHARLGSLRSTLRGAEITPLTTVRLNSHFMTAEVILPGRPGSAAPAPTRPGAPARASSVVPGVAPTRPLPPGLVPGAGEPGSPATPPTTAVGHPAEEPR